MPCGRFANASSDHGVSFMYSWIIDNLLSVATQFDPFNFPPDRVFLCGLFAWLYAGRIRSLFWRY